MMIPNLQKGKTPFFSNTFDNGFFSLNTHNTENAFNYLPLALRSFLNTKKEEPQSLK